MAEVDHVTINGNLYLRTRSTALRPEGNPWYPPQEQVAYEAFSYVEIKHKPLLSWGVTQTKDFNESEQDTSSRA